MEANVAAVRANKYILATRAGEQMYPGNKNCFYAEESDLANSGGADTIDN